MEPLPEFAALSEDEKIVRSYRCTTLRQLFHKPSIGYLSITNKRLIYHSENKTMGSESAIISEIPLQDISGVNTFIGNSINLLAFILLSAGLFFASFMLINLLPDFITGFGVSIILCLPYLIGLLFERNIISRDLSDRIVNNLEGSSVQSLVQNANWSVILKIFRIMFIIGLPIFAYNIAFETEFGLQTIFISPVLLLAAYFLLYRMIFGRQRFFGLQVTSRTAGHSGIMIQGNAFIALFSASNTVAKSLATAPAEDAETVAKELGALILDIQQMGDLGIDKWSQVI